MSTLVINTMQQKTGGPLIYVQRADKIRNLGRSRYLQGSEAAEAYASLMDGEWKPRWDVEEDWTYRQVIPYVVVQNIDTNMIVVMDRMKGQTEARLHGNVYIGAGGHIEQQDFAEGVPAETDNIIVAAAWREIVEELGFTTGHLYNAGIIGITDDEAMVNRVHLGVVYHLLTHETEFDGEKDKQNYRWEPVEMLMDNFPRFEPWSKLVAEHYMKCFYRAV